MALWENELWKIEIINSGLIPNPDLQKADGKFGFFDLNSNIYMPLAVYPGHTQHSLPQGTLIQWREKCIKMYEPKLKYNFYVSLYNDMKASINNGC